MKAWTLKQSHLGMAFLLLSFAIGFSKEDPISLLQRHRYEAAISSWSKDLTGSRDGEAAMRAIKGQAIAYSRLGGLYENLHRFSLVIMLDYYEQLAETSLTANVALYLGQIHFKLGDAPKSRSWLEKAKAAGDATTQEMANVYLQALGASATTFSSLDAQWQAAELKPGTFSNAMSQAPNSPRSRRCRLGLLAKDPKPNRILLEQALASVVRDGQEPEIVQDAGKNSQINFYDPDLLGALAKGCFALAKALNLELTDLAAKNPGLSAKFKTPLALAEACFKLGQNEEALRNLGNERSLEAELLRAQIFFKSKQVKRGQVILDSLESKAGRNASMKRDLAEVYYLCQLNPDKGLQLIDQALRDRNGPTYYRVQGGLLLAKGQGDAAIQQYAKGYKIEFRNRIDQIDPEYMSEYSFALYRNNKLRYEEIVETLYHLQKEFPPSRQMHYCMQGVSASLARSFEAQRIFRKGG
jgi:tetratricopeptide (TPR) repeat protein